MSKGNVHAKSVERQLVSKQAKANSPTEKPLQPKFCIGLCSACPYCRN